MGTHFNSRSTDRIPLTKKLVLDYGKKGFRLEAGHDAVTVPPISEDGRGNNCSPRIYTGTEPIIERFALPHHLN